MRPVEEIPGTRENVTELTRLLDGWKCCGAPSICGARCQDDEVSATLAAAHAAIGRANWRWDREDGGDRFVGVQYEGDDPRARPLMRDEGYYYHPSYAEVWAASEDGGDSDRP